MTARPIYLDYHATSPCDPRVLEAMLPAFGEAFGNASSRQHAFGREAESLVEEARARVAALIACDPREIVFTSGATESNNLAIKGAAEILQERGRHIITSRIEHKAVLDACQRLERRGFRLTYLGTARDGRVRVEDAVDAMADDTVFVSLMLANNEIGTLQPVAEVARLCRERGIWLHSDAVQALPYILCRVEDLGVDLLSIS
ncbi:MAG: aminotransferase class V-fold PLP-dependent enzyme, partial [Planctomycetes bacterium]|nr:aminotransferase class V-fold PLP-dependent enzyme [Planctomycetota bacterium]